jgi:hypothetical protein
MINAEDMILIPRAELDALRAENRHLRREAGDREALQRIRSDSGEGRTFLSAWLALYGWMSAGAAVDGRAHNQCGCGRPCQPCSEPPHGRADIPYGSSGKPLIRPASGAVS